MAFIDKNEPVVLNVKITSKGRELLSMGNLHFKYFAIGDSEINYNFIQEGINPFDSKILRPADKNPDLISFITKNAITSDELLDEFSTNNQYNEINNIPIVAWEVENTVNGIGLFEKGVDEFTFKVTSEYIKQPDLMVNYNDMTTGATGGTVTLFQAPTFGATKENPSVGDYLLIRWKGEDATFDTTGYTININEPAPILIYKIVAVSGDTTTEDIVYPIKVTLDRNIPNFTGDINVGAMVLYGDVTQNVLEEYSTDYASEALLTFLQNCQCDTITYPFWKLSIIYAENVAGIKTDDKNLTQHKTAPYVGFVNYIQNHSSIYEKLGIIHYTNTSPSNVYGEQFNKTTPTIHIPTVIWHKSTGNTIGVTLTAVGELKSVTSDNFLIPSLNTKYYDLADENGNVVGKVFVDLKIFVIEDQELLFAMSYKSNRSWTLPNFNVGANDSITDCPTCQEFVFSTEKTDTTAFNGNDGTITLLGITGTTSGDFNETIINNTGVTANTIYVRISGSTSGIVFSNTINGKITVTGLTADTYTITVIDLVPQEYCYEEETLTIEDLTPEFGIAE
jgi:hypothetical protein